MIDWVPEYAPGGHDQFVRRLKEELRRHKEQYGTVVLPDGTDRGNYPPAAPAHAIE